MNSSFQKVLDPPVNDVLFLVKGDHVLVPCLTTRSDIPLTEIKLLFLIHPSLHSTGHIPYLVTSVLKHVVGHVPNKNVLNY